MDKQIVVHIGPPKTGSSAIQKWCVENSDVLSEYGVIYPVHELDSNGVSSGNIEIICDKVQDKADAPLDYVLSREKVNDVLSDFFKSDFKVLLLSSEFFITKLDQIASVIPNVEFIGYLRNPIEVIEANYNQGVKRSGFTQKIDLRTFSTFPHVGFIEEFLTKNKNKSITLRTFNVEGASNYDVVSDFLSFFFSIHIDCKKEAVNNSYDFRALEFKRWLNKFKKREFFSYEADRILQKISYEKVDYTLIPLTELDKIKSGYLEKINKIYSKTKVKEFLNLLDLIEAYKPKKHIDQTLSKQEFMYVLDLLSENMGENSYVFYQELKQSLDKSCIYSNWFEGYYRYNIRVVLRYYLYRIKKFFKGK